MYTNIGDLGQGRTPRAFPPEILMDTDEMSPLDIDELVNPEPVIFEEPKEHVERGIPGVPTSPFEQIPPFEPGWGVEEAEGAPPEIKKEMCCIPMSRMRRVADVIKKLADQIDDICETPAGDEVASEEL